MRELMEEGVERESGLGWDKQVVIELRSTWSRETGYMYVVYHSRQPVLSRMCYLSDLWVASNHLAVLAEYTNLEAHRNLLLQGCAAIPVPRSARRRGVWRIYEDDDAFCCLSREEVRV